MSAFDLLLQKAKAAALESVSDLARLDLGDAEMAVADAAFHAVDAVMPDAEAIDRQWIFDMLESRPELLETDADAGTLAAAFVGAVRDLILDDIEDDVLEHARASGIDLPAMPAP